MDLARDIRYTSRGLRKSSGFTVAVVLTLGLGLGGNAAIFSLIDQLLLRPLPYPNGHELVIVTESFERGFAARRDRSGDQPTRCRPPTGSTGSATAGPSPGLRRGARFLSR